MSKRNAFWLIGLLVVAGGCTDNTPRNETQQAFNNNNGDKPVQILQQGNFIDEYNFPELPQLDVPARMNLVQMHNGEVEGFIRNPGFGSNRMPRTSTSHSRTPPVNPNNPQIDKTNTLRDVHKPFTKDVQDMVKKFSGHGRYKWELTSVLLVGLMRGEPIVYLTDEIPNMGDLRTDIKTRPLDDFEKKAVAAFADNRRLKVIQSNNELRVMGPIYATKACAKCHKTEGELLGAFTYTIELHPNRTP